MSRISKDIIWREWVGDSVEETFCFCCQEVLIHQKPILGSYDWVKGHIIPAVADPKDDRKPGDFVQNLQPICDRCNEFDKKFESNFHYRVHLGLMTIDECEAKLEAIREVLHSPVRRCQALKKDGSACRKEVHGNQEFCGTHLNKPGARTREELNLTITKWKKVLAVAVANEDDKQIKLLDEFLYDLRRLKHA